MVKYHSLLSDMESISDAQIAQLVEQRTENPRVAGSIPALGTEKAIEVHRFGGFCCRRTFML